MRVVIKQPGEHAHVADYGSEILTLAEMQALVGGLIERVMWPPVFAAMIPFFEVRMYVNEEGRLRGLLHNVTIWPPGPIVGTLVIVAEVMTEGGWQWCSLPEGAAQLVLRLLTKAAPKGDVAVLS